MHYLPIPEYEGLYEVSSCGLVRSLDRCVIGRDGVIYPFKGRILKADQNKQVEYLQVSLWKNGIGTNQYVHRLVATAHITNPNILPEVNHKDGNRQNNRESNLEWVTSLGNKLHAIATGLRVYTNKLTYSEFVDCLHHVIEGESYLSLTNRVPYQVSYLSIKIRKIAKELGIEHELNESLKYQRIERAKINGAKNFGNNHKYSDCS